MRFRSVLLPVGILAGSIAVLFAPMPSWLTFAFLAHERDARDFVGTLWQVTGGAIALSVTVVVFAFQAIASNQSASIRELWSASRILVAIYLGVASLIVQALALLRFGPAAPGGWPGTWATVLAIGSFLAVGILFALASSLIDPSKLHRYRLSVARNAVRKEVERKAVERISLNYLEEHAKVNAYRFSEFGLLDEKKPYRAITGARAGVVADINLARLCRYAQRVRKCGLQLVLVTRIGRRLSADSEILRVAPRSYKPLSGTSRGIVRIERGVQSGSGRLDDVVRGLHDEAVMVIRQSRPGAHEQVREAYEELLLAFPTAWGAFGRTYDEAISGPISPFDLSMTHQIARNIFLEAEMAAAEGQKEILNATLSLPVTIADRAFELHAQSLAKEMVNLVSSFVHLPVRQSGDDSRAQALEYVIFRLFEYIGFTLGRNLDSASATESDDARVVPYINDALSAAARIVKYGIDSRQLDLFDSVYRKWRQALRYELERITPYGVSREKRAVLREVRSRKQHWEFALAVWVTETSWKSPEDAALREMAARLLAPFMDPDILVEVAARAFADDDRGLSDWIMMDLPVGEVHMIDTATPILRAAAVVLFRSFQPPAQVPEHEWIRVRTDELVRMAHAVASKPEWARSVGVPAEKLAQLDAFEAEIRAAAVRQELQNSRRLRLAALETEKLREFEHAFREGWRSTREAGLIAHRYGAAQTDPEGVPMPKSRLTLDIQLPDKGFFVEEHKVHGAETTAAHWGRALANGENGIVRRMIDDLDKEVEAGRVEYPTIEAAVSALIEGGFDPNVVLVPRYGPLPAGVERAVGESAIDESAVGSAAGLPVLRTSLVKGRAVVLDVASAIRWLEWTENDEVAVCRIREFADSELEKIVDEQPRLFVDLKERPRRLAALSRRVRAEMYERVQIDVVDTSAIALVRVPVRGDQDFSAEALLDEFDEFDE